MTTWAEMVVVTAGVLATVALCLPVDLKTGKLPNRYTVPSLVLALLAHLFLGGLAGLGHGLLGFLTGFSLLIMMNLIGSAGMGDVKLMAALGAWLGWKYTLVLFITTAVVGLAYVMGRLAYAFLFGDITKTDTRVKVPYAAYVSVATVLVLALRWLQYYGQTLRESMGS